MTDEILKKLQSAVLTEVKTKQKKTRKEGPPVELAIAVLLVDLASIDQNFDSKEYHYISSVLEKKFGLKSAQITNLMNQAQRILGNHRGSEYFAKVVGEELGKSERVQLFNDVKRLIAVDDDLDGFELFLVDKIREWFQLKDEDIMPTSEE